MLKSLLWVRGSPEDFCSPRERPVVDVVESKLVLEHWHLLCPPVPTVQHLLPIHLEDFYCGLVLAAELVLLQSLPVVVSQLKNFLLNLCQVVLVAHRQLLVFAVPSNYPVLTLKGREPVVRNIVDVPPQFLLAKIVLAPLEKLLLVVQVVALVVAVEK